MTESNPIVVHLAPMAWRMARKQSKPMKIYFPGALVSSSVEAKAHRSERKIDMNMKVAVQPCDVSA